MKAPGTIERVNGIMVVTLEPAMEAEFERLTQERRELEAQHRNLQEEAGEAIRRRNAAAKRLKKLTTDWVALAERKFSNKLG